MRIKLSGSKQLSNFSKGCALMIYVGIDIAKLNHFATVMTTDGEVIVPPFLFTNNSDGFKLFLSKIKSFKKENLLLGLESTAHYGENFLFYFFDLGFNVVLINPIQTAALKKTNIRKTTTDKTATFLIIKSMLVNHHRLFTKKDINYLRLKSMCRFREKLKKQKARLKIQLVSYMDVIFPEYQYFFKSGIHINTSYALLKSYSNPDDIAALHLTWLGNLLHKFSHGHFGKEEAIALKSLAKSSVGIKDTCFPIQITLSIAQIELLVEQIQQVNNSIKSIMIQLDSVIMTIPGIGFLNGAMILGEIGNISRFSHPAKLLAYAGLDPSVHQSGNFSAGNTRMSKRGSKMLCYALVYAAWNVSLKNRTFHDYFLLKKSQGKNHFAALGHTAHKLVRVIFKMLSDNIAFNLD